MDVLHSIVSLGVEVAVERKMPENVVEGVDTLWIDVKEQVHLHQRALVVNAPKAVVDGVVSVAREYFRSTGVVVVTLGAVFHSVQFWRGERSYTLHVHENAWGWSPQMCEVLEATCGAGQGMTIVKGVGAKDRALLSWGLFTAPNGVVFQDTPRVHTEEQQWQYEVKHK